MAKKPGALYYSTLGMTILYFLAGLYFIVADHAAELFPGKMHYLLGVLFIAYGIFRIFRLKKIREATYSDPDKN